MKRNWTISKRNYLGQDRPCIISVCDRFTVSVTEVTGRTEYQWILELQDTESDSRVVQFFDDLAMAMITANSWIYRRMGFSD